MKATRKNTWKTAFFTLISILIIAVFIQCLLALSPVQSDNEQSAQVKATTTIQTTPQQVSALVNQCLARDKINGQLTLGKTSYLRGSLPLLGKTAPYTLSLVPQVTKEGNLRFKATKVEIGKARFPVTPVLFYYEHRHSLPSWLTINATQHEILVKMAKLPIRDVQLTVQSLNWSQNQMVFNIELKAKE